MPLKSRKGLGEIPWREQKGKICKTLGKFDPNLGIWLFRLAKKGLPPQHRTRAAHPVEPPATSPTWDLRDTAESRRPCLSERIRPGRPVCIMMAEGPSRAWVYDRARESFPENIQVHDPVHASPVGPGRNRVLGSSRHASRGLASEPRPHGRTRFSARPVVSDVRRCKSARIGERSVIWVPKMPFLYRCVLRGQDEDIVDCPCVQIDMILIRVAFGHDQCIENWLKGRRTSFPTFFGQCFPPPFFLVRGRNRGAQRSYLLPALMKRE